MTSSIVNALLASFKLNALTETKKGTADIKTKLKALN